MAISRKAVAYLTRQIAAGSAPETLFAGLLNAVEKQNQNLVVFRGGYFGKDPGAHLYGLVNDSYAGAITWASVEGDKADSPHYRRLGKLPVVSLTLEMPPFPVVMNDSYAGVLQLIEHLIGAHGKRRLAFVRGPESHPQAQQRYQAYEEALRRHGLPLADKLISPFGNWDRVRGTDTVRLLLDERRLRPGVDFDALVCVNDNIAIHAIQEFQRRGIRVPEDIVVTGCNDDFDARVNTPPVTTVSLPGDAQAAKALEVLNTLADGGRPSSVTKLPGRLVVGQSCGCSSHLVQAAASGMRVQGPQLALFRRIFKRLTAYGFYRPSAASRAMAEAILEHLEEGRIRDDVLLTMADPPRVAGMHILSVVHAVDDVDHAEIAAEIASQRCVDSRERRAFGVIESGVPEMGAVQVQRPLPVRQEIPGVAGKILVHAFLWYGGLWSVQRGNWKACRPVLLETDALDSGKIAVEVAAQEVMQCIYPFVEKHDIHALAVEYVHRQRTDV